jgi:hypothetical protein
MKLVEEEQELAGIIGALVGENTNSSMLFEPSAGVVHGLRVQSSNVLVHPDGS